jgi:hypothetical protein
MRTKKPSTSKLKAKADSIFSKYIRLRDAKENGLVTCVTCPTTKHWKEMQNGHWISRGVLATRFHEHNCHAQCWGCNGYGGGKGHLHELAIIDLHGEKTRDELLSLSKQITKNVDYNTLIEYYTKEFNALLVYKGQLNDTH